MKRNRFCYAAAFTACLLYTSLNEFSAEPANTAPWRQKLSFDSFACGQKPQES